MSFKRTGKPYLLKGVGMQLLGNAAIGLVSLNNAILGPYPPD